MANIEQTEIRMPFIPLNASGNELYVIGAKPEVGRTFYTLHMIEENSLKGNKNRGLVYFISHNKQNIIRNSSFAKMLYSSENIDVTIMNFWRGKKLISIINQAVRESKFDYIIIDGFEKLFNKTEGIELQNEVDGILSGIKAICEEESIPVILTTSILLCAEKRASNRPLLCSLGSDVLEITGKHILSLTSPFYSSDRENVGEDDIETMVLYKLMPSSIVKPNRFQINKDAERFHCA